ncbi:beta-1,4-galactosyltransferase 1-like [Periophthalmus magnuspinnatus]|uniref:beta-1,4-galactosyltransferase 1-like n=1 Tax=Periophthalmus magnuspinnatus TaxID=409849 RepID=UPI00145B8F0E|nr:beta-1,4-galactosyltransferase 1-like [Periophthalmus magnuspinnatus]XP_055086020.1 beta-1,4-galactosyltransferase 1-like [Periophthalmus magnuspinnatus]XP_055086021.1 beta-1,4-galactosyltransferase 1-like [Periophthalmus magnuspinnatus]
MIKTIFIFLAFFGFLTMTTYVVVLYSRDTNITPLQVITSSKFNLWKNHTSKSNETEADLPDCPETPPALVGPLRVEFYFTVKLDALRQQYQGILQGGKYKPPNCKSKQKVAVIIPFRDRHEHLGYWLYYLHPILMRQQLDYGVFVINQDGQGIFNRAKLMNVGVVEALKVYDYDCLVFSDVDLVPLDDRNLYKCFDNPRHLAVAMDKFGYDLPYSNYYGGVSSLSKDQYMEINGFSNTFWGWGGEDDDIYNRIVHRGMSISRPDMATGRYRMIRHFRDRHNEPNPQNEGKLPLSAIMMRRDGLNSLSYKVKKIEQDVLYTFITVDIHAPLHWGIQY